MPLFCPQCKRIHTAPVDGSDRSRTKPIRPLSSDEERLMRVMLVGSLNKTYFCDLLCYLRYRQKYHPDGYVVKTKTQIEYDYETQHSEQHSHWKQIPWLEDAYKKAQQLNNPSALVSLEREDTIIVDTIDRLRREEEERLALMELADVPNGTDRPLDEKYGYGEDDMVHRKEGRGDGYEVEV